jgi:hypothetical protein
MHHTTVTHVANHLWIVCISCCFFACSNVPPRLVFTEAGLQMASSSLRDLRWLKLFHFSSLIWDQGRER